MPTTTAQPGTSADVCTATHIHHIQPPTVALDENTHQRRYGPDAYAGTPSTNYPTEVALAPRAGVCRYAEVDLAEVTLQIGHYNTARITLLFTPAQLRELAGRLLDAAADIETHPAAVLTRGGAA